MPAEETITTLGEELKKRRESLGISLREISDDTRIGIRFLKAIETNQFNILPGGIFNRSFIRAYARYVGVAEETALQLYSNQMRAAELAEQSRDEEASAHVPRASTFQMSSGKMLTLVGVIATAVFAIIVWGGVHFVEREASMSAVESKSMAPTSATIAVSRTRAVSEPGAAKDQSPTAASKSKAPQPIRVEIRATQGQCWVSYSLDQQASTQILLTPGNQTLLEPKDSVVFTLGNAKAVEVAINGQRAAFDGIVVKNILVNRENYQRYLPE